MLIAGLVVGGAVAAGTYLYAKNKKASQGQSAAAAAAGAVAGYGATAVVSAFFWPVLVIGGAIAGGYYVGVRRNQKALPPSPEV